MVRWQRRAGAVALALSVASFAGCADGSSDGGNASDSPQAGVGGGGAGAAGNIPGGQPTGGGIAPTLRDGAVPMFDDAGTPILEPIFIDACGMDNAAGLDATQVSALKTGGAADDMRWLYPYDGALFPRDLMPPLLMWAGHDVANAVYVHVKSSTLEYHGCLLPSATGQVLLPDSVWDAMGDHAMGKADPFTMELSVKVGDAIHGPVSQQILIARASLKGSIYYNSYSSEVFRAAGGSSGAVLRIPPGDWAGVFLEVRDCHGCHSVSANGSRLVGLSSNDQGTGIGLSYQVSADADPVALAAANQGAIFPGLTPDGSFFVSHANIMGVGPQPNVGPADASLIETDTGTVVSGSGVPAGALMPTFSSDGKRLIFNDYAINNAHGLAMMDFDLGSRSASGYRKVYENADHYPAWPFMLPDNGGVVFTLTESEEFTGEGGMITAPFVAPPANGPASDLHVLDLSSGQAVLLAQAMGFRNVADAASKTTYLPFGVDEETGQNYYPTVSPVAAGGYFWVFFDSIRHLGNLGRQRGLWATALTVSADGSYQSDPSHPPFYVPGQEYGAGNHRAFTALDPCQMDGDSCETGVDCCNGFCSDNICDQPDRCSQLDEACEASADCCSPDHRCIGGYCGIILVE